MVAGKTRWGVKKRLLGFHNKMNRNFKLAAKGSKDSVYVNFGSDVDFELNYFLEHWVRPLVIIMYSYLFLTSAMRHPT